MRFLFILDVILSVVLTIGVVVWLNPYTSSVWPAIGACIHLLIRGFFCKEAMMLWNSGSGERWRDVLGDKHFFVEIVVSLILVLVHGALGYVLWNGFYGGMTFFAMWGVSQVVELAFLMGSRFKV